MKKRSPNSSRGSASCSLSSRMSKRLRDKATSFSNITSDTNSKNEISKYFIKETLKDEREAKKQQSNFESPYKNIISEPTAYLNNSLEDENDFKNPQQFKPFTKVLKVVKNDQKPKSTITKRKTTKKRTHVKGQVKLTKMIEEQLALSDTNPEHLQMALALSKSEQSTEESDSDNISPYPSTQEKQLSLRETLEQFGFKSDKEMERKKPAPKRKKKSMYQFVKPILYLRTEQDRQNLISTKISTILSENSLPEYSYEKEKLIVRSKYLSEMFDDTLKLSNLHRINHENLTIDRYYLKELNIEVDTAKCGHRLKDWHKIPGRERTPPREVVKLPVRDVAPTESNANDKENVVNSPKITSDVEKTDQDNLSVDNLGYRSISPDLFTSEDEEIDILKKSIDEKLQKSLEMIEKLKTSKLITTFNEATNHSKEEMECVELKNNELHISTIEKHGNLTNIEEKLKNNIDDTINITTKSIDNTQIETNQDQLDDDMNKTDDILATLEITLTETIQKVTTPINKNLNAFSASLLSNFDSLNKRCSRNGGIENSDESTCELTFTSMKGIEHFESFYDQNRDESDENLKRIDEVYDLTLSEGEERILDGDVSDEGADIKRTGDTHTKISDNIKDKDVHLDKIYDLTQSDQDFDEKIDKNCIVFDDSDLNLPSTDLMDYRCDINEVICDKSINDDPVDKKEKIKSKYEILSDSDEDSDHFGNKLLSTDPDITALLKNTIKNVKDDRFKSNLNGSCNNFRKSLSFTPNSNPNSPKFFKKHATFSTPSPQKENFDILKRSTISTSSVDFHNEVICISDEELNYSSIHSTVSSKRFGEDFSLLNEEEKVDENINTSVKNNDIENYSYLEKYYDEQFYTEYNNDLHNDEDLEKVYSPITHPRILELSNKKKTPLKETPISLNKDGLLNHTSTPSNDDVIIKTKNITPMPDYDNMNTPTIVKELEKIGVKHLKRHRGVQILKHIYENTHPICSNEDSRRGEDSDDNISAKRPKLMEFKSRRKLEIGANDGDCTNKSLPINTNRTQGVEIVGDIFESGNLIFERKQSKKVSSCAVPLHIAWYNLVASNTELKQNILLYEPLQLEILYLMLKEQGFNYNIQDLLTFLDKKCITIQTGQNNKQSRKRF